MFTNLISAADLQSLMQGSAPWLLFDVGFDLTNASAGERALREGHLPGAHYVHLDTHLCGPKTGRNGRHPLPDRTQFAATVGQFGVAPQTQVVIYDRQGAMYSGRLWWMLRWLGHGAVAVLDGGVDAWQRAGGTLTTDTTPLRAAPPYPAADLASLAHASTVTADEVQAQIGKRPVFDARAGERFRGETEPLDAQAGHIPGARNRFFKDNLAADGRFKPADQLRAEFTALLGPAAPQTAISQCGSGVTACHNLLAMDVAGLHGAALYPGSWSEWSSDPARPIAVG
ncbi:MAG: Sulfurtransferase [Rhizobacter sp.]|nr:Sulfurtransferase [Rhizobacter sp.]